MELTIVRILFHLFASALKVKICHYSYGNINFVIILILFSLYAEKMPISRIQRLIYKDKKENFYTELN